MSKTFSAHVWLERWPDLENEKYVIWEGLSLPSCGCHRGVSCGSGRGGQSASRITRIHCLGQWGNWGRGSQWIRPELQPPVLADLAESQGCQTSVLSAAEEGDFRASLGTSFLTCDLEAPARP